MGCGVGVQPASEDGRVSGRGVRNGPMGHADRLGLGMGRQASMGRWVSVRRWMSVGTPGEVVRWVSRGRWASRGRWVSMGWWAWVHVWPAYEDGWASWHERWLGGWPANSVATAKACSQLQAVVQRALSRVEKAA